MNPRKRRCVYVIGALANPMVPEIANRLDREGYEAFADWYSPGEEADLKWQAYEYKRGRTYREAINGYHARHVFEFDKFHLDRCDAGVLVLPAGKSGHLELGYLVGKNKRTFVLFDQEPRKFDVMYRFVDVVVFSVGELVVALKHVTWPRNTKPRPIAAYQSGL